MHEFANHLEKNIVYQYLEWKGNHHVNTTEHRGVYSITIKHVKLLKF